MKSYQRLANAAGYQIVWLCAVAGAGQGMAWAGPLALLAFAVPTLAWDSVDRARDLRLMAVCIGIGALADGALSATGWLHYASPLPWSAAAPLWILSIWAAFGLTLDRSLAFLQGRPAWCAALGAIGAPLAYASASRGFEAVAYGVSAAQVLAALALLWAGVVPLLLHLARLPANPPKSPGVTA